MRPRRVNNGLQIGNQSAQFPWVREFDKRVVIFGLNSNNLGNFTFLSNAKGKIGQNQLLSFAEQLYTHRNVPVKIVVLHHSPHITEQTDVKKRGGKLMGRLMLTGRRIPNRQQRILLLLCLSHGVQLIGMAMCTRPKIVSLTGFVSWGHRPQLSQYPGQAAAILISSILTQSRGKKPA